MIKRKIFLLSFVYNLNKCLLKYVKYAYDFLERKKSAKSWSIFFELFQSLWKCLRDAQWSQRKTGDRTLTDLKSTWILGGVLEKSLNFFSFEWSGAESELFAQSLVFFSFVKQL